MKLSIVIVHWNTPKNLKRLLSLLSGFDQTVVVDNASADSVEWIKKEFPKATLIQNESNQGYARACNQGAREGIGETASNESRGSEWILFLNPDVITTKKEINGLIDFAEKNKLDACSPKTTDHYRKPLPTGLSLLAEFSPLRHLIPLSIFPKKTLFGGCLLIRRGTFEEIGGWDERFFLWFEDSDLTYRLVRHGKATDFAPFSIRHEGGTSFQLLDRQKQRDIFFHSMDVFARKYFSFLGQWIVTLIHKRFSKRILLPVMSEGLTVTVPNLKAELLKEFCINNLHRTPKGIQWVVVTSSIQSDSVWDWRNKYPDVRFIPIEKNRGFASTVNVGFRCSPTKLIGTTNDDTRISKDIFLNLISCMSGDTSIGSVNPVIYREDKTVESAGIRILKKGKAETIQAVPESNTEVDATNAACILYRSDALQKVGFFDERFGSYLEDIDLSLRLKRAGFKNIVCVKSSVVHQGQSTSKHLGGAKAYLDFKNWILIVLKNWSVADIVNSFPSILLERLRNISGIVKASL